MRLSLLGCVIALGSLMLASTGFAQPPDHAPAHGYRAKKQNTPSHEHVPEKSGGFQVVFDSERGISIVVGFPGVYAHGGHFYRRYDGGWQMSSRADSDWKSIKATVAPEPIRKAHRRGGPAKPK